MHAGAIRQARPPIRFDRQRQTPELDAPTVGEHTESLLAELGYSAEEIAKLVRSA